jgi:hypothetical protein
MRQGRQPADPGSELEPIIFSMMFARAEIIISMGLLILIGTTLEIGG